MKILKNSIVFILIFFLLCTNNIYSNNCSRLMDHKDSSKTLVEEVTPILVLSGIILLINFSMIKDKEKRTAEVKNYMIEILSKHIIKILSNKTISMDELENMHQIIKYLSKNKDRKDVIKDIVKLLSDKIPRDLKRIEKIIEVILSNKKQEDKQNEITEILSDNVLHEN